MVKIFSVDSENLIEIASRVFGWFGSVSTSLTYARLMADKQTDVMSLKAPFTIHWAGLNNITKRCHKRINDAYLGLAVMGSSQSAKFSSSKARRTWWNKTEIKHWNKTLKQPETVLAFAHDETEIKQNCWRSAETKQPTVDSFVLFQFYFTMCDGLKLHGFVCTVKFGFWWPRPRGQFL